MGKVYTRFQTKQRKTPTRWGCTFLYGLNKEAPPRSFPYIRVGKVSYSIFPSRTLFGTQHVRGKMYTVFLTSGGGGGWILIFLLVLYSPRSRLGLNGVQFSLLHDTEKLAYSILHLATRYSARGRRVTLQCTFVFDQFTWLSFSNCFDTLHSSDFWLQLACKSRSNH